MRHDTVQAVFQTRDGCFRTATRSGLGRSDGLRWTVFRPENTSAMINPDCRALAQDGSGRLWVGTVDGLLCRDQDGFACVGDHAAAAIARARIPQAKPDVVLLDLELPGLWGHALIGDFKVALPRLEIVMLTVHDEPKLVLQALEAGAGGYLIKAAPPAQILDALAEVHRGGAPMTSGIARLVLQTFHERGGFGRQALARLRPFARRLRGREALGVRAVYRRFTNTVSDDVPRKTVRKQPFLPALRQLDVVQIDTIRAGDRPSARTGPLGSHLDIRQLAQTMSNVEM